MKRNVQWELRRRGGLGRGAVSVLLSLVAAVIVGCSSSSDGRPCPLIGCERGGQLTGALSLGANATQLDVHFCFEQDCRDGLIDLTSADWGACSTWEGGSRVCLAPSGASGVYDVTAWWDQEQTKQPPPDGSTYELRLSNHESNQVLFEQTLSASYVTAPDLDGCLPDCWGAQLTLGGGAGEGGAPPDVTLPSPSAP
jgi:hypothetical protein